MTYIETEQLISDKENELKVMLKTHEVVEQEKLSIQRQIIELQLKKKDLEIAISKSGSLIRQKGIEIKLLTRQFWAQKREIGA